jgi:hypothetical protein
MSKRGGAFRTLDHPRAGCHCAEHEAWRTAHREYMRAYTRRKVEQQYAEPKPEPLLVAPPVPEPERLRMPRFALAQRIEQCIAAGLTASQTMRRLGCEYADVRAVRVRMEEIVSGGRKRGRPRKVAA